MKDRLLTLLGAIIAFYLLVQLLFPQVSFEQDKISLPTSEDHGKYGLAGLYRWLDKSGIRTHLLRERYDTLVNDPKLAERGNLLVISLPLRLDAQVNELEQLQHWVSNGNNLLLLTAMSDWPEWAERGMGESLTDVLGRFDLQLQDDTPEVAAEDEEEADTDKSSAQSFEELFSAKEHKRTLAPTLSHPLTRNIHTVAVNWLDSEGINWQLEGTNQQHSTLVLLRDQADQGAALWLGFYGEGRLLVSRHSEIFGNVSLGQADNAVLMENIVTHLVSHGGQVIFDDMHQGLSAIYDPDAFFRDPRLHHTLLFLLALWIVYVMGHTNRFVQVRERLQRLQLRDHVTAVGNLFARRLHSSAVALRYAQHFFNDIRSAYGLPQNGQPVWDLLQDNAAIDPHILQNAEALYQRAAQQKKVNLIKFFTSLKIMRKELT